MAKLPDRAGIFSRPYRITKGKKFRLKDFDPADTGKLDGSHRKEASEVLASGVRHLAEVQDRLYAQDKYSVLLIFQAMDAAGKDGTIKHVMSGVNPLGCQVYSFKAPTPEELDHDFMWRTSKCLPERGRIGIFNRSYYEEVLAVRIHPEFLAKERIPKAHAGKDLWENRYADINAFESYLARQGTIVLKFFLNVSKEEQRQRFLARLEEPEKNWKFSPADARERRYWDKYQEAFQDMIRATATESAPWYVVPADNKWYTRLVVSAAIIDALSSLDLSYPKIDTAKRVELEEARKELLAEAAPKKKGSKKPK